MVGIPGKANETKMEQRYLCVPKEQFTVTLKSHFLICISTRILLIVTMKRGLLSMKIWHPGTWNAFRNDQFECKYPIDAHNHARASCMLIRARCSEIHNTKVGLQFSYANTPLSSIRWNPFPKCEMRLIRFTRSRNGQDRVSVENRVTDSAGCKILDASMVFARDKRVIRIAIHRCDGRCFGVERMTLCSEIELRTFSGITIFRSFVEFLMTFRVRGRNKSLLTFIYLFI